MGAGLVSEDTRVVRMASVGSVREPRWMFGEQEVGREMDGCWRSERERRGRVTKPDSRPGEKTQTVKQQCSPYAFKKKKKSPFGPFNYKGANPCFAIFAFLEEDK